MGILWRFGKEFFMTMFWVFAVLIIGFILLTWLSSQFGGNIVGQTAGTIEHLAGGPN